MQRKLVLAVVLAMAGTLLFYGVSLADICPGPPGCVSTSDLADLSVTKDKIRNRAVGSAKIRDNAVVSRKIKDLTIRSEDLGPNSVTGDKVLNGSLSGSDIGFNSIPATDIQNEPGIDWQNGGSCCDIPTTVTNCGSVSVTAPSSGYVLVQCKAFAVTFGEDTEIVVGVSTSASTMGESTRAGVLDGTDTKRREFPIYTFAVYPVSTGTATYYCNAQKPAVFSSQQVNLGNMYMTAVFFPTAY